ncbi:MAG: hypothetical protein AB1705_09970 [Verrucomicrobiota bacterium]
MKAQPEKLLNLRHLPARLNAEETAIYFNMAAHDIPILVSKGLLKPLGNPVASSVKYFATATLEELRNDVKWLHRATAALREYWSQKNARKTRISEVVPFPESPVAQQA